MFERNLRLEALFMREINFALRNANLPDLGGLFTLTGTKLSKDKKNLTVYYSVYGTESEKQAAAGRLEEVKNEIRLSMKRRLRLKIIPNIFFEFDDTACRAERIEAVLRRIEYEKNNQRKQH